MLYLSENGNSLLSKIFLNILEKVGRRLIGLLEKGSSGDLTVLEIRIMIECF